MSGVIKLPEPIQKGVKSFFKGSSNNYNDYSVAKAKIIDNYDFYGGFEGEPEIVFKAEGPNMPILHNTVLPEDSGYPIRSFDTSEADASFLFDIFVELILIFYEVSVAAVPE